MKFAQKHGWLFLVILIIGSAFFRPPSEYTVHGTPYFWSQTLQGLAASNGIDSSTRVQLMQIIQEQIIQQDKDFAHMDSLRNVKPKK